MADVPEVVVVPMRSGFLAYYKGFYPLRVYGDTKDYAVAKLRAHVTVTPCRACNGLGCVIEWARGGSDA